MGPSTKRLRRAARVWDFRAAGAGVVAVSVDPVERNREVVEKLGLDFPILSDGGRRVIAAYGVVHRHGGMGGTDIARPAVILIGPDGVVRWRGLTESWRVRERPQHVLDVLSSLR